MFKAYKAYRVRLPALIAFLATALMPVALRAESNCVTYALNASAFPINFTVTQQWTLNGAPRPRGTYTQSVPNQADLISDFALTSRSVFQSCNGAFTSVTRQTWIRQPTSTDFFTTTWNASLKATGTLTITFAGVSNTPPVGTWTGVNLILYSATAAGTWKFIATGAYNIAQSDSQAVTFRDTYGNTMFDSEVGSGGTSGTILSILGTWTGTWTNANNISTGTESFVVQTQAGSTITGFFCWDIIQDPATCSSNINDYESWTGTIDATGTLVITGQLGDYAGKLSLDGTSISGTYQNRRIASHTGTWGVQRARSVDDKLSISSAIPGQLVAGSRNLWALSNSRGRERVCLVSVPLNRYASGISYQLLIEVAEPLRCAIGRLGEVEFLAGHYVYTGSAKRGLEARIARHARRTKALRWHIDYLLSAPGVRLVKVRRSREGECALNRASSGRILVLGFGASDCRAGCGAHLKYLG